jgi:hypothetical protein
VFNLNQESPEMARILREDSVGDYRSDFVAILKVSANALGSQVVVLRARCEVRLSGEESARAARIADCSKQRNNRPTLGSMLQEAGAIVPCLTNRVESQGYGSDIHVPPSKAKQPLERVWIAVVHVKLRRTEERPDPSLSAIRREWADRCVATM